ncbi:MAG: LLM class flavin-dependent oxidoreductase [Burkholderiaceae bacterium]|jgi:alkanesulfonate monooxygenase SsuD/methylene tetrahydromethanopterin reductase-like flavin-dependent oxidoreductase (luciferase family)|uniref:LLM class flavin-dependent oxidoreductase n=1 Tax=Xenophilus sp. Marseille-Q4582 TaxID=2866600 RepID=UPI000CA3D351|nr:LLM class flavin-dependent oxidoreductase [Xenophilus sp. Marseille-Q4582]ART90269.1 alkanal monooxygenase alpha chain [uncultured bacterium]MBP8182646.1 LLM class flavin-dependent oxidoreductase [Rhodoferax sp.]MBS1902961.1 LLM class flavin-dependent oxidoreductase [Bacteroidota bacterium]MCP5218719.1 LLM class flavin-dependent oxidoreductase [Burkholderiaceae bacterium]
MQHIYFTLMPYRPLDMEAAAKQRSAWVVLPNSLYDPKKGADDYESHMNLLEEADALGFDGLGVNEHHQTAYGMMPAPNLIASAIIQRTKRAKIAILGRALPLVSNPIYIAEEFAMLDNLSRGRLICGFVRGIGAEYHAAPINPAFSHGRFHEAHDLIVKAWTTPGPFAWEGEYYNHNYVNLWPRPYQSPRPPIWIPSQGSAETIDWAAHPDRKYPFLITFAQESNVIRNLNAYREKAREYGYEASSEQLGWAAPVYVADTYERAIEEARAGVESLFNNYLTLPMEMLMPPGYTSLSSMKKTMAARAGIGLKRQTIEEMIELGTVVVGTPTMVRDKIQKMRDATNIGIFVALLQIGVMGDELARRNMQMYASEVMPHLK